MVENPLKPKKESQRHFIFTAPFWISNKEGGVLVTFDTDASTGLIKEHPSSDQMEQASGIFRLELTRTRDTYYIYQNKNGKLFFINTRSTANLEIIILPITTLYQKTTSKVTIKNMAVSEHPAKVGEMLRPWMSSYPEDFS